MWLYATHTQPKVSNKPIKVYKVLRETRYGFLETPYQGKVVTFTNGIAKLKATQTWDETADGRIIGACGVHAFTDKSGAVKECSLLLEEVFVYEAKIPPFTPYWTGIDCDIAATELIIHNCRVFSASLSIIGRV